MTPARWFLAAAPAGPDRWNPRELGAAADRAVGRGYTGMTLEVPWATVQAAGPAAVDFASVDWAVKLVRSKGLALTLLLNHAAPPVWVDAEEFGMRDPGGRLLRSAAGGFPLLTMNARQVRDWVGVFVQVCAAHYKDLAAAYEVVGPHWSESGSHRPGGPALDHSRRAAEAYHGWLHGRYVDIRLLNEAWEGSYKTWDEIPVGEGTRKATQADFHHFRTSTLVSWHAYLAKALKAGFAAAPFGIRSGGERLHANLGALAFDLGRHLRVADLLVLEEVTDLWTLTMLRSGADLLGRRWGVAASPAGALKASSEEAAADDVLQWGRNVYNLGGYISVRGPLADQAGAAFEDEIRKIVPIPPAGPRLNRRAVYVSAAETMFWDVGDYEAARGLWTAATDHGKKTALDVISDGMFVGEPDVLKRYTAGIEVPFARVVARDAHQALLNAKRSGIRLAIAQPAVAGALDEYGRPQAPLAS